MTIVRKTAPSTSNKYFITKAKGGYSTEINIKNGSTLPNCVGYAGGAFMEQEGRKTFDVPTCNAESWIVRNTKYPEGRTAKIGAIIVWAKGKVGVSKDGAGHVGIVCKIYKDGSIDVAQSAYGGKRFYITHHNKNYKKVGYSFQGFILPTKEVKEYDVGKYLVLVTKQIRTSPEVSNNKTGKTANKGSIVDVKEIKHNSDNTVWGKVTNGWICLCNKDGSTQVTSYY